jgi:hypothetical protein
VRYESGKSTTTSQLDQNLALGKNRSVNNECRIVAPTIAQLGRRFVLVTMTVTGPFVVGVVGVRILGTRSRAQYRTNRVTEEFCIVEHSRADAIDCSLDQDFGEVTTYGVPSDNSVERMYSVPVEV